MAHRRSADAEMARAMARRDRAIAWRMRQAAAVEWARMASLPLADRPETRSTPISAGIQGSPAAIASRRAESRRSAISTRDAHEARMADPAMRRAAMMLWRA